MKKYLVIGNPIEHSLSPKLHNYWIKHNKIDALYGKEKLKNDDLEKLIKKIKLGEVNGVNVTVPFKKKIIKYLDKLSPGAQKTQSVNTIFLEQDKIVGHNTDIEGFGWAIKETNFNLSGKKILILGAGGVVPSIIYSLYKMKVAKITVANRTKENAEDLKRLFKEITIVNWGEMPKFEMIINATSIGLNNTDRLSLDFSRIESGKFFYDLIYNPKETRFLKDARKTGNIAENGKKMFIYQAAASFKLWHNVQPEINDDVNRLLD